MVKLIRPTKKAAPRSTIDALLTSPAEEKHNEARRKQYKTDPDYKAKQQKASRAVYRRKRDVDLASCLHSLAFIQSLGVTRQVKAPNGKIYTFKTLTLKEAADAMQKIYQTVWRWVSRGQIPPPVLMTVTAAHNGRPDAVYHIDEVIVMIEEIGNHERLVTYFRRSHEPVIHRVFDRIGIIRKKLWS